MSSSFAVRAVGVEGTHHLGADAVRAQSGLPGAQLFVASAARARERVLLMPAARDARVELALPDGARVSVIERTALGRWVSAGTEWFVDDEGVLFSSLDPAAAPQVRVRDERAARRAGDRIDPAVVRAALRLARLGTADLRPDATSPMVVLTSGADGLVVRTAAFEIRFGGPERLEDKLALARRTLRENPTRKLDYVDVRTPDLIVISPK